MKVYALVSFSQGTKQQEVKMVNTPSTSHRMYPSSVQGKLYLHTFAVVGAGQVPADMLRYDQCWPDDGRLGPTTGVRHREQLVEIGLAHIGPKVWEPTRERWASFGWRVL